MPCKSLGYGSKPCKRPASLETKVEGTLAKGKSQPQGVTKSLGKGKKALEKGKKTLEEGHQGMKDGPWYNVRKTNAKKNQKDLPHRMLARRTRDKKDFDCRSPSYLELTA